MAKIKWMVAQKKADFDALSEEFHIDKVLARIIRNRGLTTSEEYDMFLNAGMDKLHDGRAMKDMVKAVDIIKSKIKEDKKIRIIGDYDVDGITATFILLKTLRKLGAKVDTVIPHRINDGYGLNDNLIMQAKEDGIDTILTCDNGIAATSQIELANSYGMTVVVTDHHEVPYEIINDKKVSIVPPAAAVVDPKQGDCEYPFKGICGAFVAYKFAGIILEDNEEGLMRELLPFAALATVCDVMELLDENRVIVKAGLNEINNDPSNIGLKALILATGLQDKKIGAYHFGFILGPAINSTGRLDTAQRALELFDSDSFREACMIATELKMLNDERKLLTEKGVDKASLLIDNGPYKNDKVLVIYLNDTHESVAGIIAGRLKEKYYRPTIVLTDAEDGIKGSARSVESYDMYEELNKVKDLFTRFGGHKMAAGVSLSDKDKADELRRRLNENCVLNEADLCKVVRVDLAMPLSYITGDLIKSFDLLEPCGTANPKPVFAVADVSILSYKKVGRTRQIAKLIVADAAGKRFDTVYFGSLEEFDAFLLDSFGRKKMDDMLSGRAQINDSVIKMVYSPEINVYNNIESIQIIMKYFDI